MFLFFILLTSAFPAFAQTNAPVRAELVIPPAETHVIGDVIPLFFRFENQTTNALAFMWEGCCRFNGKLTVTRGGREIPPTPPGQALAHMFAKAERLDPGKPKDFDTRLSDWVTLADTGTYELRGRYQGVLPFQQPQVQRGLQLWRDTAETPPLQVSVLNVPDYLAQRDARTAKRGVKLELTGPSTLPPLQPVTFKLKLTNTGTRAQTLRWPDAFQLWLVRSNDTRVPAVAEIDGAYGEFTPAPGLMSEREIRFDSSAVEGEPFGDYQLFVDLAADGDQPRVPSNVIPLAWKLDRTRIVALLNDAATGGRTGARNAPLKLLRVYLGELGAEIAAVAGSVSPAAQALARDLAFAAAVRPLRPAPGTAELNLRVAAAGASPPARPSWQDAPLQNAMPKDAAARDTLRRVLDVRRHLGWEVAVNLVPDDGATLGALADAAREVNTLRDELSRAPRVSLSADTNRVCFAEFPATPSPATLLLRLAADDATGILQWAVHCASGGGQARPVTLDGASAKDFTAVESLEALLAGLRGARPAVFVRASASLAWEAFRGAVQPLVARGVSFELAVEPPPAAQPE